jgi:hypothetical protein
VSDINTVFNCTCGFLPLTIQAFVSLVGQKSDFADLLIDGLLPHQILIVFKNVIWKCKNGSNTETDVPNKSGILWENYFLIRF